ncbi:type I DNA topoisomerase [uncultured Duncaniella sp.]|uniref:type I DNA topoisomerase n=1 Tax=uncultured Duncaniella sp. TaxID=2768039 RepID=UPI0025AA2A3A|nr:type I DNA topoisomerase [uncultured Duncaniella sp.]
MLKNLVIVESPAKAKTIEKFLGKDYKVMSSYGHIRDLRKKDISIKVDSDFQPVYEIPTDKKALVAELKKAAKEAETVWLASDEDREGEAIAWHLYEVLGLKPENTKRIVFHEITKNAILHAIEQPRDIDLHLVDAQQARRVLDRLVGFELSPVLWKKIKPALSAGRVQSVAVRLIVDRENEIQAFKSEPYYRVTALFNIPGGSQLRAELSKRLPDEESAREFLEACKKSVYTVTDISVKPLKKSPAPPFTTSTLQQEAGRKLGFTVSQTMMIAQKLYEAGHITYMRTDSLNLSQLAINSISNLITDELGEKYLKVRRYHTNAKGAQEAHEAIRPTYIDKETIDGSAQEKRLYRLIRLRTMASQMADAELEKTTIDITPSERPEHFTASGEVIKFDGFLKVYLEGNDDDDNGDDESGTLPPLKTGETLTAGNITATERFTLAPPRYTESSLVKKMEELGIGRPSTYAPTISTIQHREYIVKGEKPGEKRSFNVMTLADGKISSSHRSENVGAEKGKLIPTDTGIIVNEFLTQHFPDILDYDFTADMEQKFDRIAEGESDWNQEIARFYGLFHPEVEKANELRTEHKIGERILGTDPTSGEPVSVKIGRFGPIVQIGSTESKDKPRFASLRKDQSVFDIQLEDALKLFELPREVGEFEGKQVIAAVGRFGPYLRHDGKFVSIPKDLSPTSITIEEAEELIKAKREADSNKVIKIFDEDPEMQILNGRYGVYIAYKKNNYKIPKSVENPADLTIEQVRQLIEEQDNAPKRPARRASGRTKKS